MVELRAEKNVYASYEMVNKIPIKVTKNNLNKKK